jgi:hypothetical protein
MDFWNWFFILLIFIPLTMLWAFALVDVFVQQSFSGVMKALWVIVIIAFPWIGTLVYLIVRPKDSGWWTRGSGVVPEHENVTSATQYTTDSATAELATLAGLHDRGKLTDEEYDAAKRRVIVLSP